MRVIVVVLMLMGGVAAAEVPVRDVQLGSYAMRVPAANLVGAARTASGPQESLQFVVAAKEVAEAVRGYRSPVGLSGSIRFVVDLPVIQDAKATVQGEVWSKKGRYADFTYEQLARTSFYRAYDGAEGERRFWHIVSARPDGSDAVPAGFEVARCTFADQEKSRAICRAERLIAPGMLMEFAFDEQDIERLPAIDQYLQARVAAWRAQ